MILTTVVAATIYGWIEGNSAYGTTGGTTGHVHATVTVPTGDADRRREVVECFPFGEYCQKEVSAMNHHHDVTVSFPYANHLPPYLDVIFAKANRYLLAIKTNGLPSPYTTPIYVRNTPITDDYGVTVINDGSPDGWRKWFEVSPATTGTIGPRVPAYGTVGVRYAFKDWSDGSTLMPHESLTLTADVTLTVNYKTQYYLAVGTDPPGLTPQPTMSPSGPWYDEGTVVTCTAHNVAGYVFDYWTVDDLDQGRGDNPIPISMYAVHTATAHYIPTAQISLNPTCGPPGTRVDVSGSYFNRNIVGCIIESNPPELFIDSVCEVQYVDHIYATVSGYFDVADGASGQYTVTVVRVGPGQRVSAGFNTDCPAVGGVVVPVNKLALVAPYLALFGVIGAVAVVVARPWKKHDNQ